jgi:hypothetical protein
VLGLTDIHDRGKFGKKTMLYAAGWLTWTASKWAYEYTIAEAGKPGLETAAVLGAVLTPIYGLTGWVFKSYLGDSADQRRANAVAPETPNSNS